MKHTVCSGDASNALGKGNATVFGHGGSRLGCDVLVIRGSAVSGTPLAFGRIRWGAISREQTVGGG